MPLKSAERKIIAHTIHAERSLGKTNQEIYNGLTAHYEDKKSLALLILGTASEKRKDRFKILNYVLLSLLGVTIILKAYGFIRLLSAGIQSWVLLLSVASILISLLLFVGIAGYKSPVYYVCCGLLSILGIFATINQSISQANEGVQTIQDVFSTELIATIGLLLLTAILSFLLKAKLFPQYDTRKLKKDSTGEYILN